MALFLLSTTSPAAAKSGWIKIASGDYRPLFAASEADPKGTLPLVSEKTQTSIKEKTPQTLTHVDRFILQKELVTNGDFLQFVSENSEWQKNQVKGIFADKMYLLHWNGPLTIGDARLQSQPVVNVSWFAARAYCRWIGARLPTSDEWEYVLSKDVPEQRDQTILAWYSKPSDEQQPFLDSRYTGKLGAHDMVGRAWEWTLDFNSSLVTGESREDTSLSRSMFCGAGSIGAADPSEYATFMRLAFRSSLKGNYALPLLGFRCAMDRTEN